MSGFTVIIPARIGSVRLPGKALLDICGKPMLQHTYERARESRADDVIVATDDEAVFEAARGFGARVFMTSPRHTSGTERIAEVVARLGEVEDLVIVNVQADEPLLPGTLIDQVAANLAAHPDAAIATLAEEITHAPDVFAPDVVKVVCDRAGYALYFSRAPIPWHRDAFARDRDRLPAGAAPPWRHIGIYAYRAAYLSRYAAGSRTELEKVEALEQLRALYRGDRIHVALVREEPGPGVDTVEDLERVRALMAARGNR